MSSKLIFSLSLSLLVVGGCATRRYLDEGSNTETFQQGNLNARSFGLAAGEVVLTFDDGPSPLSLSLAQSLKEKGVIGHWFINYKNAMDLDNSGARDVVKKICEMGHQVGNHNDGHTYNTNRWDALDAVHKKIVELCPGQDPLYYRAPGGIWSSGDAGTLNGQSDHRGQQLKNLYIGPVYWDVACDTESNCQTNSHTQLAQRYYNLIVKNGRCQGGIVLGHDVGWHEATVKAFRDTNLIQDLKNAGCKFVTLNKNTDAVTRLLGRAPNGAAAVTPSPIACPAGYELLAVGTKGGRICTDGTNAWGPFTEAMIQKCIQWAGAASEATCRGDRWSKNLAINARGTEVCPVGATLDAVTGYCVEGDNAFGPFPPDLVAKCESRNGGSACKKSRWSLSFLKGIMGR